MCERGGAPTVEYESPYSCLIGSRESGNMEANRERGATAHSVRTTAGSTC
jgi:hypothetical protein